MIDPGLLKENLEQVQHSHRARGGEATLLQDVIDLHKKTRHLTAEIDELRNQVNTLGATAELAESNRGKLGALKEQLSLKEKAGRELRNDFLDRLRLIGNILDGDVPSGDESANLELRRAGPEPKSQPLSNEEILERAGWLDLETARLAAGSRHRYFLGEGARFLRELMNLAIEIAEKRGFTFVLPPVIINNEILVKTGFFPKGRDDTFTLGAQQSLVGTSEPSLLALAAEKKWPADRLPLRFVGFSTCFRQEAGSYGRDVKGAFRVHQFDKVELVSIVHPDQSAAEHQYLVETQRSLVDRFQLPYREVLVASQETGHTASRQIDLEVYFPAQKRFRETHSASNCTDFQSQELRIKVETESGSRLAHTLNATLTTERLFLAIAENYQQPDGQIKLPWDKLD